MNNDFDKELREMAIKSKIKESETLKEKVAQTYKGLKRKNNSLKKWMGTVAALIACTIIFSISFPAYAKEIPVLKEVMSFLNNRFDVNGYAENSEEVDYSAKVREYTLNIENIYYDGADISVFYNITSENKLNLASRYSFHAEISPSGGGYMSGLEDGEFIDDNTFAGMVVFNMSNVVKSKKLSEMFKGNMDITKIYIQNTDSENKDSESQELVVETEPIKLSLKNSNELVKEYKIDKEIVIGSDKINILNAKLHEIGIYIERSWNDYEDEGTLGEVLWDSKKGKLKSLGGQNIGDIEDGIISSKYELPSEDGELKIIPIVNYFYGDFDPHENRMETYLIENGKKYDFGNYGTVEIKNIEEKDDKTLITARTTGYRTILGFQLFDQNGKQYYTRYEENKNILGDLDMEATYVFNKLDLNEKYYIETFKQDGKSDFKILTDQIINIDIK